MNTTVGENYTQSNKRWRGGRRFGLTIKYSFGNIKGKQKRSQDAEPMDQSGYGDSEM